MKILLSAPHRYPSGGPGGVGPHGNPRATGGSTIVHDHLAKGLAELGHEVYYHLQAGHDGRLPAGVRYADRPVRGVEILHYYSSQFLHKAWPVHALAALGVPWIATCHRDSTDLRPPCTRIARGHVPPNWVAVSRTLAELHGQPRYVLNGIDPAGLIYSAAKEDYFLFVVGRAQDADPKGIGGALELARIVGFELVVIAGSASESAMHELGRRCREQGARFVGDTRGRRKAELFAGARALLFPTRLNEGFGLVLAEALMSGTPVITSRCGACPEIVTPEVGFVCDTRDDYLRAIDAVAALRPEDCRARAMAEFHYVRMARDYVREYAKELDGRPTNRRVGER